MRTFRWLVALVCLWLGVNAFVGVVALEGALHPPRNPVTPDDVQAAAALAQRSSSHLQQARISASDGAVLRAWAIPAAQPASPAVILLHGQADNRAGMLGAAGVFLRHGYSVLLPDARGHGESGGSIVTYGVLEADDIHRWLAWIEHSWHPSCIYGIGDSMGGGELIQSLATRPPFCAVVAESPFSSFREAAYDRLGQFFGTGPWLGKTILRPAISFAVLYARLRYRVNLSASSPELAASHSSVPLLLIHGLADTNLPPRHSEQIAARDPNAQLWEPPGVEHCGAAFAVPHQYESRVTSWFQAHSAPLVAEYPR